MRALGDLDAAARMLELGLMPLIVPVELLGALR